MKIGKIKGEGDRVDKFSDGYGTIEVYIYEGKKYYICQSRGIMKIFDRDIDIKAFNG